MDALGKLSPLVEALMNAATDRHRAVAANLANVETPGYRAVGVKFDAALEDAVREGDLEALRGARAGTFRRDGKVKSNGNDVDLDVELGEMNRNSLAYQTLMTAVMMRQQQMRSAVAGRST
ncbi:MAG TPA: flagellar basal body rod protein FlgB [Planctomycetota bacterium]|nr:flagellar basal body rod protein FlgB [Planctomycetota bacterium]